jgi:3-hydroxyisobutyrate dehydrogenase
MVQQLGFIGLGTIGFPICRNLAEAGVRIVAFDAAPRADRVAQLRERGAQVVETLAGVARDSDAVMTVLPDSAAVESVVLDPALLEHLRPGTIWIETSSGYPSATVRMAAALASRGVTMIDAPICKGSVPGAYNRQLTLCVGGDPAALDRVRATLSHVASTIIHVGPLGAGHAVKIINNSISAAVNTVVAEGIALGEAFGLERDELVSVLSQCSASKASFERAAASYRQPPPQTEDGVIFQLYLMTKDLRYSTALAGELGSPHPATDAAHGLFAIAERVLGSGAESNSAPSQLLQHLGSRTRPAKTP